MCYVIMSGAINIKLCICLVLMRDKNIIYVGKRFIKRKFISYIYFISRPFNSNLSHCPMDGDTVYIYGILTSEKLQNIRL